jgi:hypothetical protein
MATEPTFITIGTPADKIDVLLSYRIVELCPLTVTPAEIRNSLSD